MKNKKIKIITATVFLSISIIISGCNTIRMVNEPEWVKKFTTDSMHDVLGYIGKIDYEGKTYYSVGYNCPDCGGGLYDSEGNGICPFGGIQGLTYHDCVFFTDKDMDYEEFSKKEKTLWRCDFECYRNKIERSRH